MSGTERQGVAPFVPRARILKLLGGELIRDDVMAVIELVKNAHDADATTVKLDFIDVNEDTGEGPAIIITDDGDGMTLDRVLNGWLQPAASSKRAGDGRYTARGRRVLGEKGVGRFAVDRLARHVELVTRHASEDREVVTRIDWDDFDSDDALLSDVEVSWETREPQTFWESAGTKIRMTGIRSRWTDRMFRRLSGKLQRLVNPLHPNHDFSIQLESNEFPDYSGRLRLDILEQAPYKIDARFDGEGMIEYAINGGPTARQPWNGTGRLVCGPARIRIHAFDLDAGALSRIGPRMEVRAWLREWSGISIYRDNFRVLPYGEPDDDWLRLDQRRVNTPTVRLSNNQVCGFVEICQDQNPDLKDQTNRGGLVQNQAFEDLRRLCHLVLQIIEAERQGHRKDGSADGGNDGEDVSGEAEVDDVLGRLEREIRAQKPEGRSRLAGIQKRLRESIEKERQVRRDEVTRYADLAALGHSAAFLPHVMRPQLSGVEQHLSELSTAAEKRGPDGAWSPADHMRFWLGNLGSSIELLSTISVSGDRLQRGNVELAPELDEFQESVTSMLEEHNVRLVIDAERQKLIRPEISRSALRQVLLILLLNSLDWLPANKRGTVKIRGYARGERCIVRFRDSGPGVPEHLHDRIFTPGFSAKEDGRGMGLSIARNLLTRYGSSIRCINDRRSSGATFELAIKQKPTRS